MQAQPGGDIEAGAFAIAIELETQSVMGGDQRVRRNRGSSLLVRAHVVTQIVALARHAEIEGANVAQEPREKLRAYGIARERPRALGEDFRAGRWRGKVLHTDRPIETA